MTALGKLFRATAFRLALAILALSAVGAGIVLTAVAWQVVKLVNEETARTIDAEIRSILERTHDRVRGILTMKKGILIAAAQELKRTETLEGERLRRALAGESTMEATR